MQKMKNMRIIQHPPKNLKHVRVALLVALGIVSPFASPAAAAGDHEAHGAQRTEPEPGREPHGVSPRHRDRRPAPRGSSGQSTIVRARVVGRVHGLHMRYIPCVYTGVVNIAGSKHGWRV